MRKNSSFPTFCSSCTALVLVALASGCGANFNSIHRESGVAYSDRNATLISQDAKQRALVFQKRSDEETKDKLVYCVEPSPDALTVLATAFATNVSIPEKVALAVSGSSTETGGSIGLRTQSIQLLRDQGYRVCEAYANGALNDVDYATLMRRNQVFTTAVLAIEQLTGPVLGPAVALGASANAADGEALLQLQQQVEAERAKLKQRETELSELQTKIAAKDTEHQKETDATKKAKLADELQKLKSEFEVKQKTVAEIILNLAALEGLRDSARTPNTSVASDMDIVAAKFVAADRAAVANVVGKIVDNAFGKTFILDFCQMYWHGRFSNFSSEQKTQTSTVCDKTLLTFLTTATSGGSSAPFFLPDDLK